MERLRLPLFLFTLFTVLVLFSCDDDKATDDEDLITTIVGIWQLTATDTWYINDGDKKEFYETYESVFEYCQFRDNGTGILFYDYSNNETEFIWSIKDNVLTFVFEGDYAAASNFNIIELTSTVLIFEDYYIASSTEEYYKKETYKRVNYSYEEIKDKIKNPDEDKYEQLHGVWKWVTREGWEYKGQKHEYREDFTSGFEYYEFISGGDGNISWEDGTSYRYKWEIKDDILTIYFIEHYEDEEFYFIAELNSSSLILENKGFDPEGNDWCHRRLFVRQ